MQREIEVRMRLLCCVAARERDGAENEIREGAEERGGHLPASEGGGGQPARTHEGHPSAQLHTLLHRRLVSQSLTPTSPAP